MQLSGKHQAARRFVSIMHKFNLEPLLNHHRYQEEILQKELAVSKRNLAEAQKALRLIKRKKRKYSQELQRRQEQDAIVVEIGLYLRYLERLSKNLDDQKNRVLAEEKKFHLKRKELIEVMKKRKALDKLKEKSRMRFQHRSLKKDRNFMDEVASNRFTREG